MLKIRLSRTGKKSQPSFRIVVQEHSAAVKGKFIEELGFYRPADNPKVFKVNVERVKHWVSVGAQPSDSLASLLKRNENMEGMDKYIGPRDKKAKKKGGEANKESETAKNDGAKDEPPKAEEAPTEAPAEASAPEAAPAEEPAPEAAPEEPAEAAPAEETPAEAPAPEAAQEEPAEAAPAEEPAKEDAPEAEKTEE